MTIRKRSRQLHPSARRPGYSSLIAVLVTAAIGVTTVAAITMVSISALKTGRTVQLSVTARGYADACAEEALWQLQEDNTYTSGTVLSFSEGSCTIVGITGTGETNRTVQVVGTVGDVIRRVEVTIADLTPPTTLTAWEEVSSF